MIEFKGVTIRVCFSDEAWQWNVIVTLYFRLLSVCEAAVLKNSKRQRG